MAARRSAATILNSFLAKSNFLAVKPAKIDARKIGHLTNGVWQDGKGYPQEGGHRVPFIASWPGEIELLGICF